MTSKPNTHHGAPVDEWFEEEEARDPGFLARIDVQIATDDALTPRASALGEAALEEEDGDARAQEAAPATPSRSSLIQGTKRTPCPR